jgi:solute carrier family 9B (sodium/hydrogen exchanger), member 1/2
VNLDRAWKYFEILLFVLVGALVDPKLALSAGLGGLVIVGIGLVGRCIGVLWALHASDFKRQEKLFSLLAYTPKATVQAAMGGIPLSLGVVGGDIILAIAVLSIFITAPLGAILIDKSYKVLLSK